jgi:hypothetical protein
VTGVSALTVKASQLLAVFTKQRILGFYRDNAWANSLGYPPIDFQDQNPAFAIADTAAAFVPDLVYNPAAPFLSGGNLPNVLAKFAAADYVFSPDKLLQLIETAGAFSEAGVAAGLSVATASLDFSMSSKLSAGIADELTLPVTSTVTTTPSVAPAPPVDPFPSILTRCRGERRTDCAEAAGCRADRVGCGAQAGACAPAALSR